VQVLSKLARAGDEATEGAPRGGLSDHLDAGEPSARSAVAPAIPAWALAQGLDAGRQALGERLVPPFPGLALVVVAKTLPAPQHMRLSDVVSEQRPAPSGHSRSATPGVVGVGVDRRGPANRRSQLRARHVEDQRQAVLEVLIVLDLTRQESRPRSHRIHTSRGLHARETRSLARSVRALGMGGLEAVCALAIR
jgi:hypothetical protein